MMSLEEFDEKLRDDGWVVFPSVFDPAFVAQLNDDLAKAYEVCRPYQIRNGIAADTEYTAHHVVALGGRFLECLVRYEPLMPYLRRFFQGNFILNSFAGVINCAHSRCYLHRVHRDIRTFSGNLPLMLNTLVMLDDFTPENGSTYLMPGSHRSDIKPSDEVFFRSAKQALGKAGSILVFNSNMWHAGGQNKTSWPRRALTPIFCKPFIKQGFDYPRALGYANVGRFSEHLKQLLGYNARAPETLDEWYQPPHKRSYRPDQG